MKHVKSKLAMKYVLNRSDEIRIIGYMTCLFAYTYTYICTNVHTYIFISNQYGSIDLPLV